MSILSQLEQAKSHMDLVHALRVHFDVFYVFSNEILGQELHIRASSCAVRHPDGPTGHVVPLALTICRHALNFRAPLAIDDTHAHPLVKGSPALDALGVGAYLGVPSFLDEGQVPRTLCALHVHRRVWSPADIRLMQEAACLGGNLPFVAPDPA